MPHRFAPSANKKQIASQSGGNQGLGFAVPINTAVAEGVLVAAVSDGSPAATAGIKGGSRQTDLQGHVYVVGGETLAGMEELGAAIMKHKPGDTVTLTVVSGGRTRDVKVTLAERPSSS